MKSGINTQKKIFFFIGAFFIGAFSLWVLTNVSNSSGSIEKAPSFVLQTVDNQTIFLEDLRGKTVILNFWAAWCTFCRKEMPILEDIARRYKDRGVIVLGVHRDTAESLEDGLRFAQELGISYTLLQDKNDNVFRYFAGGSNLMPLTVFLDTEGNVRERIIGSRSQKKFEDILEGVLN